MVFLDINNIITYFRESNKQDMTIRRSAQGQDNPDVVTIPLPSHGQLDFFMAGIQLRKWHIYFLFVVDLVYYNIVPRISPL